MKRGSLFALILVTLLSISLVSAQTASGIVNDINKVIDGFVDIIKPVAERILGAGLSNELLFAKVLFLILILAIVWYGLEQLAFFAGNKVVHWIVSIVIAILATRWIATEELINTILLPYTTLGVAIAAGIPFVIYFAIVNLGFNDPRYRTIRKIAWILFAVIFVVLWILRYESLGGARWVYPITALASLLMLALDGTITSFVRRIMHEHKMSIEDLKRRNELENLLEDLKNLRKDLIKKGAKEAEIKKVDKRIDELINRLSKI